MIKVTFENLDAELYHLALLLAGDKKANAIKVLRTYDRHFNGRLQDVVNYLESYIEQSLRQPSITATNHAIKTRDVMEPLQLPDRLWWAMVNLMEVPASRTIMMPHLLPFGCYELRADYHDHTTTNYTLEW